MPDPTYCPSCGKPAGEGHPGCAGRAALEPPRFCPDCGRRMVVQVTPLSWTARCAEHGTTTSGG